MNNKKKPLFLILIFLLMIIFVVGGFLFYRSRNNEDIEDDIEETKTEEKEEAKKKSDGKPLLYKVTKDGSDNVLYMFGSIHVADDRAYPMDDAVMKAYNESDSLIVEFDLVAYSKDIKTQMSDIQLLLCDSGKTFKDYISPETYEKVIQYMKDNNIYNSAYEMYKPAFIYTLVTNVAVEKSGLDANKGIDMYFLKQAHKDKKEIIELESSTMQMKTLLSLSDELYEYMLDGIVSAEEEEIEGVKNLYEAWLNGDVEEILKSEEEELPEDKADLADDLEQYNEAMLTTRNEGMINKVNQGFAEGKRMFLVVGTAHIVGEGGIASVLADSGYKVERIEY